MTPPPDPVASDDKLPARAGAVVIGGGIIGVSTALALAEKGVDVVLCEKGSIGAEQSSRNWGWCRTQGRDPREIELSQAALRMWRGLDARIGAETGFATEGLLYAAETETDLASYRAWMDKAHIYQPDVHILSAKEVADLLPGAGRRWVGGLYSPSAGRAEPRKAAPAIALGARKLGARVFTNCAVRGIETSAGRVSSAHTERGQIKTDTVVLAGGAWSRLFCGNHDIDFPQLKVRGSVLQTAPLAAPPMPTVGTPTYGVRRRLDGGFTVANRGRSVAEIVPDSFRLFSRFMPAFRSQRRSLKLRLGERFVDELRTPRRWQLDQATPFERERILDPSVDEPLLAAAMRQLVADFPAFAEATVVAKWAGLIDVTPDAVPVIGPVPSIPGFYLASGFSGHGFGLGPAAGRQMADIVTGSTPLVDPKPLRFGRFTDGSPIEIH